MRNVREVNLSMPGYQLRECQELVLDYQFRDGRFTLHPLRFNVIFLSLIQLSSSSLLKMDASILMALKWAPMMKADLIYASRLLGIEEYSFSLNDTIKQNLKNIHRLGVPE